MTEYGLQMYSLRDVCKEDLKEGLRTAAKLGYKYVEFAGFFDHTAEEVRSWLDEFGLSACGTHTKLDLLDDEHYDATVAYHKTIGCTDIIVPSAHWTDPSDFEENIKKFNALQKKLEKDGITLGYHNHSKEFLPTPHGKIVEDELLSRTSIHLEIDTFWLFNAHIDPVPYLEAHKDRIHVIHLKDGFRAPDENFNYDACTKGAVGKSTGEGDAPVKEIRRWAVENGVLIVIESEGQDPTGPAEVGRCISFLRSLD